jgi:hypothetical protein
MSAFHPRIRALVVGVSAVALVAIGVGGTVAASNPAMLYACYDVNGNVRMSDSAICKLPGGGRLASWGTTGVPGPTGPIGPTGLTGAQGAAGTGATTRLVTFSPTVTEVTIFSGAVFDVALRCSSVLPSPYMGRHITVKTATDVFFTSQRQGSDVLDLGILHGPFSSSSNWTLTVLDATDELWLAGGGESFHMIVTPTEYAPDGSCQLFATY